MNTIYKPARGFLFSRVLWALSNSMQLLFTLLWTAACICLALGVLLVTRRRHWPLRMASGLWAPGLLWGAGAQLRIEGLENIDHERAQVLVANHQSIIDICVLFRAVPVPLRFVLKQELARVPFVGWYARAMGMVFIRRGSAHSAAARLRVAVRLLKDGHSLCAFPEGTRSRDGTLKPFKGGAFHAAMAAQADIVPVAIEGSGRVLPAEGFAVRPGIITLRIGKPIPSSGKDRHVLARQAHGAVSSMLEQMRRG
ncbi:MAG: lysophospholipid acyltransferase family protein [Rhodanobacteraceae bacterium]